MLGQTALALALANAAAIYVSILVSKIQGKSRQFIFKEIWLYIEIVHLVGICQTLTDMCSHTPAVILSMETHQNLFRPLLH